MGVAAVVGVSGQGCRRVGLERWWTWQGSGDDVVLQELWVREGAGGSSRGSSSGGLVGEQRKRGLWEGVGLSNS